MKFTRVLLACIISVVLLAGCANGKGLQEFAGDNWQANEPSFLLLAEDTFEDISNDAMTETFTVDYGWTALENQELFWNASDENFLIKFYFSENVPIWQLGKARKYAYNDLLSGKYRTEEPNIYAKWIMTNKISNVKKVCVQFHIVNEAHSLQQGNGESTLDTGSLAPKNGELNPLKGNNIILQDCYEASGKINFCEDVATMLEGRLILTAWADSAVSHMEKIFKSNEITMQRSICGRAVFIQVKSDRKYSNKRIEELLQYVENDFGKAAISDNEMTANNGGFFPLVVVQTYESGLKYGEYTFLNSIKEKKWIDENWMEWEIKSLNK